MRNTHWTDDDLLNRLYGVGSGDGHLDACSDCRLRWQALVERRRRIGLDTEVPAALLAAQRQAIWARLERRALGWTSALGPALALAGMVVFALWLLPPAPRPRPAIASSESQLYLDVYAVVASEEPAAIEPMHALFEE